MDTTSTLALSDTLRGLFVTFRAIFLVLDIGLLATFCAVFYRALETRPRFVSPKAKVRARPKVDNKKIRDEWHALLEKADLKPPESYVLAIIEADKFVDGLLKQLGFQGEHMADRLERIGEINPNLSTLDRVWQAHRIRNELVHTPDFEVSHTDAHEVLKSYEAFLREAELL